MLLEYLHILKQGDFMIRDYVAKQFIDNKKDPKS